MKKLFILIAVAFIVMSSCTGCVTKAPVVDAAPVDTEIVETEVVEVVAEEVTE
jgi:PBP1b-binding outer membrane lipoprotein LpoB